MSRRLLVGKLTGPNLVAAAMILIFVALLLRNAGLHPRVFWDEWHFSRFARLYGFHEATIPSYVYFLIYRATNFCGDGFLDCARVMNALFFVSALPFIYLIARRFLPERIAVAIAMLSAVGPVNTYTAYFMPEAIYFFAFWGISWIALSFRASGSVRHGAIVGLVLGLMVMIKVHALFVAPALAATMVLGAFQSSPSDRAKRVLLTVGAFIVTALATRLVLGYLIAGRSGLNILGGTYGSTASSAASSVDYIHLLGLALQNLRAHLLALVLMFGVPVAALLRPDSWKGAPSHDFGVLDELRVYAIPLFGGLMAMTALFAASVTVVPPFEKIENLHARYYNFAYPILFMVAAGEAAGSKGGGNSRWQVLLAAIFVATGIYGWTLLGSVDFAFASTESAPEINGFRANGNVFRFLAGLGIVSLVLWGFNHRLGARIFLFAFLPLSVLSSSYFVNTGIRSDNYLDVYDRAGKFAHTNLTATERARLVVVSHDPYGYDSAKALFQIDHAEARAVQIAERAPVDWSAIPKGTRWILLIGDHAFPPDIRFRVPMNGFSLLRVPGPVDLDFSRPLWPGDVVRADGLHRPSRQGAWSIAKAVRLELADSLPREFDLHMDAVAFGPNVDLPFSITIGGQRKEFRLAAMRTRRSFAFSIDEPAKTIVIEVPKPASPSSLGLGGGLRELGLRLETIRIVPKAPAGRSP